MEPQFSVVLYSKYSPMSKKILDIIQSSRVNLEQLLSLQTLCIDNEKVRKRIYQNKQIDITSVPCILVIFPDGGIEKYDGMSAFQWIEEIIDKFAPPPPPAPQQPPPSPRKSLEQIQIEEKRKKEIMKQKKKKLVESQREQERLIQKQKYERHINKSNSDEEIEISHTNIDDLDSEEDDYDEKQTDRYRHKKPIGSIRQDSGNYTLDDDLFAGDQPDNRQAKKSAVKQQIDASQKKTLDLMAKAKEMEKGRQESPLPPGHPSRT